MRGKETEIKYKQILIKWMTSTGAPKETKVFELRYSITLHPSAKLRKRDRRHLRYYPHVHRNEPIYKKKWISHDFTPSRT